MILILLFYDSQCDKGDKSPPQSNVTLDKGDENDMVEIAPQIAYDGPGETKWMGPGHGTICHAHNCQQGTNWANCECRWDECCSVGMSESRCTKCIHIAEIKCTDNSGCGTSANGEPQCCEYRKTNTQIMYEKICGPCTPSPFCHADGDCPERGCCRKNGGIGKCKTCGSTGACEADYDCAGAGKCCKNKQCVACPCLPGAGHDKTCRGNCGGNGRDCQTVAECQGGLCCPYITFPENVLVARDEYSFKDKLQCGDCNKGHCMDDCGCTEGQFCSEKRRCEPIRPPPPPGCRHDADCPGKCCQNGMCSPCEIPCLPGHDKTCRGNCGGNGRDCQSVAECQGGLCCLYMTFPKNALVARDEYSFKDKLQCGSCSGGHCMDDCGCREGLYCSEAKRCEPRGPRPCSRPQVGILMGSPDKIKTQNYPAIQHISG